MTPKFLQVSLCASFALMFAGCSISSEAYVKPVFHDYDKVAIWPRLTRPQEELFTPLYMQAFPQQAIIERRDLEDIMREQDMLPDRLDAQTRADIRRIYGVKAIVWPNYTPGYPSQLFIKVIDTETGEIVASAVVFGRDHNEKRGLSEQWLVRLTMSAFRSAAQSSKLNRPSQNTPNAMPAN